MTKIPQVLSTLGIVLLWIGIALSPARADTVTSLTPGWINFNSGNPNQAIWGLPELLEGPPPTGVFVFDQPIFPLPGGDGKFQIILDSNGVASDVLILSNAGPGGAGMITFNSDSDPGGFPLGGGGRLCIEGTTGCVGSFNITLQSGAQVTIDAGGDGELPFDPFGFGYPVSDAIRFNGVTAAPEPSSLLLLGIGLFGLLGYRWRAS